MHLTRRKFIRQACLSAVPIVAYAGASDISRRLSLSECMLIPERRAFPLGVSSGDVTQNRAILWTRYASFFTLKLAVFEKSNSARQAAIVFTTVHPLDGGYVHVDVTGLKSHHNYQFLFLVCDNHGNAFARSRPGNFKTAPDSDALVPVTLGAVSCTHNDYEPVVLEHAGARQDIDAFLLLGDTSYNDGCRTYQEFSDRWGTSLSKKGYLDLRASTSVISTLDDHEFADNFDPETIAISVRNAGLKTFFENTPIRVNAEHPLRIWRSFRYGKTCEIFVLDGRTERRPSTRHNSHQQYLSREQMDWLKHGLRSSDAVFKIIMNSVPIGTFPFFYEGDRWEGYPQQREEILSFIDEENITTVVWLSGDFHFASIGRVSYEGPGCRQTEILAGPGAQSPNYLAAALNMSPQFDWASVRNNYVTLHLDPQKLQMRLVYHGGLEDPTKTQLSDICEIHSQIITQSNECLARP